MASLAYDDAVFSMESSEESNSSIALGLLYWDAALFYRDAAHILDKHQDLFHKSIEVLLQGYDLRFWDVCQDLCKSPGIEEAAVKDFLDHYRPMVKTLEDLHEELRVKLAEEKRNELP